MKNIPFSPPRFHPELIDEISDTLKTGWITTGPKTKKFEQELISYTGCKKVNALNSATAGMEIVLRWFGVGPGDEVIIPAYTYCATANVVMHLGAKPVMVDINKDDFNINVQNIRNAITKNTKVLVPVDIGGLPCDYKELNMLVRTDDVKHLFCPITEVQKKLGRILVMSDSAHSFGAEYEGARAGSLTDVSVFSFHAVKNLTTAEGGAICWNLPDHFNCEEIYNYINTLILHGQSKDALSKTKSGGWKYDVAEPGFKCNMTDVLACIGLVELSHYEETLKRRKDIVEQYNKGFENETWSIIPEHITENKQSSFHLYMLRIKGATEDQRDKIIEKISEKQVSVNVHFIPLPLLTAYHTIGYDINDYPETYSKYSNEISLPVYFDLSDEQVQTVISAVKESVNSVINA